MEAHKNPKAVRYLFVQNCLSLNFIEVLIYLRQSDFETSALQQSCIKWDIISIISLLILDWILDCKMFLECQYEKIASQQCFNIHLDNKNNTNVTKYTRTLQIRVRHLYVYTFTTLSIFTFKIRKVYVILL